MLDEICRIEQGGYNIIINETCKIDFSIDEELMKVCFMEDTKNDILNYIIVKLMNRYNCKTELEALSHWSEYKGVIDER